MSSGNSIFLLEASWPFPFPSIPTTLTRPQEVGVPFLTLSAPAVVSGMSGESEKKIREIFEEARVKPKKIF